MTPRGSTVADAPVRCDLNESAFAPLPAVVEAMATAARDAHRYPEFTADRPRLAIAAHLGIGANQVTVGPGGTAVAQAIMADAMLCAREHGIADPTILTPAPTFDGFGILARILGVRLVTTPLDERGCPDLDALAAAVDSSTAAVILCSPHNPTGAVLGESRLRAFLADLDGALPVILDQAYIEYCECPVDAVAIAEEFPNVCVLRTFSKAHALAGVRIGYAFGAPSAVAGAQSQEIPFAISAAAAAAVPVALLAHRELDARMSAVRAERTHLARSLASVGVEALDGHANFVYLPGAGGLAVGRALAANGIHGRFCGSDGFRLTVLDRAVTERIIGSVTDARKGAIPWTHESPSRNRVISRQVEATRASSSSSATTAPR
ncbi:pyridoxal phosphate-dependent aminotransferase [Gordonia sp. NPDC003950]